MNREEQTEAGPRGQFDHVEILIWEGGRKRIYDGAKSLLKTHRDEVKHTRNFSLRWYSSLTFRQEKSMIII